MPETRGSLADAPTCLLTGTPAGLRMAAYVLLSSGSDRVIF
jgi:hypothetical protein